MHESRILGDVKDMDCINKTDSIKIWEKVAANYWRNALIENNIKNKFLRSPFYYLSLSVHMTVDIWYDSYNKNDIKMVTYLIILAWIIDLLILIK